MHARIVKRIYIGAADLPLDPERWGFRSLGNAHGAAYGDDSRRDFGFLFIVAGDFNPQRGKGRSSGKMPMLHDVCQFVGRQMPASRRSRQVIPRSEYHIGSYLVSQSICRARRLSGAGISMHPDTAEVVAEAGFQKRTNGRVPWLAGGAENFVGDRWHC